MANKPLKSIKFPGLTDTYTIPQIDTSLTVGGKAADAQAVGNKFTEVFTTAGNAFPTDTASGAVATFADGADDIPMKSVKVAIEPVQSGSGDPSPTNVRPISGWTGAQVVRAGKNLIPYPYSGGSSDTINGVTFTVGSDGTVTANGTATANAEFFVAQGRHINFPAGTYTLSGLPSGASSTTFVYNSYAGSGNSSSSDLFDFRAFSDRTVTVESEIKTFTLAIRIIGGYTANNLVFKPMFELGSTATDYEPYAGDTYSITFPTEAGTVYGGELDVTNGALTVDRAFIASYNGETLPSEWISDRDKYVAGTTPTTGAQVCYKLSQAVVYTLTPTEIKTLLGDNNVWADAGDTEVTYRADTAKYIDKKIAEVINALS